MDFIVKKPVIFEFFILYRQRKGVDMMKLKKWIDKTPPHIYIVVKALGRSYILDNLPLKLLDWQIESVDNHLVENYDIEVPESIEVVEVIHIMKE